MITPSQLVLLSLLTVLLAMVVMAMINRLYSRTWLGPGWFFLIVWFLFIAITSIIAPGNTIYPFGNYN